MTDSTTDKTWHKVTKSFKGGRSEFQIAVPKGVRLTKGEWETILEWLGENTNGGHNYGYGIETKRLRKKSETLKVVRYPSGLCTSLLDYGTEVVTKQRMI